MSDRKSLATNAVVESIVGVGVDEAVPCPKSSSYSEEEEFWGGG